MSAQTDRLLGWHLDEMRSASAKPVARQVPPGAQRALSTLGLRARRLLRVLG
jgi:hypothetical protein